MTLQDTFFEVWIVVLFINGGILIVSGIMPNVPMHTPFNSQAAIATVDNPHLFSCVGYSGCSNSTGTLVQNITNNVANDTTAGGTGNILGNPLGWISNNFFFVLNVIWGFVQFFTGGFFWQVISIFGFPSVFVYVMQGLMGIFMVIGIKYQLVGR